MRPSIDALLRYPVFRNFSPAELSSVARLLRLQELDAGQVLFEKGDVGESMFFLDIGHIQIDSPTTPGNYKTLAKLNPPTMFGEMSLLNDEPRSARVLAIKPSVLWEMSQQDLINLAEEKHAAAFKIMSWIAAELSNRLRDSTSKLVSIYAKPFQSIQELKEQLALVQPEIHSEGFSLTED